MNVDNRQSNGNCMCNFQQTNANMCKKKVQKLIKCTKNTIKFPKNAKNAKY